MEAQAVARVWSGDWKIPVQMLPRVQQLRDEAKQAEQAKSFTILTATLIAGVLALLLMLWSKLVSWALIALLSNVGIFALWRLLRFLESQWKARRNLRKYSDPTIACGLLAYLEGAYQFIPREPVGKWLVVGIPGLGVVFALLALEE